DPASELTHLAVRSLRVEQVPWSCALRYDGVARRLDEHARRLLQVGGQPIESVTTELARQGVGKVLEDRLDERPPAREEAVHQLPRHPAGRGHLGDLHRVHAVLGEQQGGDTQQIAPAVARRETAARRRTGAWTAAGPPGSG